MYKNQLKLYEEQYIEIKYLIEFIKENYKVDAEVDPSRMVLCVVNLLNQELIPKNSRKFNDRKHKKALRDAQCLDDRYDEFRCSQKTII